MVLGMRKTKFDYFIFYCKKTNVIWQFCWDYSCCGIESWYGFSGRGAIYPKGKFKKVIPKSWVLIDRLPEGSLYSGPIKKEKTK